MVYVIQLVVSLSIGTSSIYFYDIWESSLKKNVTFFKLTMRCCEECCEQMEEDAYSEWLRANDGVNASQMHNGTSDAMGYFLGEVMFPYQADSDFELSLSVGDYVVIREVVSSVWAEGECKGNAGWFTYIYIERRDRVFATKVIEVF
ncbi:putative SH3 domain-containing protein [Arabidopsis thaliana]